MTVVFFLIVLSLPQLPERLHDLSLTTPTEIFSETGELIVALTNRDEVKLNQISPHFINAILAMEDTEFYTHHGLNKKGLIRAFMEAGVTVLSPGCGSCMGGGNGSLAAGDVCLSTANSNSRGRMGSPDAEV